MNSPARAAALAVSALVLSGSMLAAGGISASAADTAPDDVCSNIADVQSVPPEGYVSLVDGTCVAADLGSAPLETTPTDAPTADATDTATPTPNETAAAVPPSSTTPTHFDPAAGRAAGFGALAAGIVALVGALAYRRRSLR